MRERGGGGARACVRAGVLVCVRACGRAHGCPHTPTPSRAAASSAVRTTSSHLPCDAQNTPTASPIPHHPYRITHTVSPARTQDLMNRDLAVTGAPAAAAPAPAARPPLPPLPPLPSLPPLPPSTTTIAAPPMTNFEAMQQYARHTFPGKVWVCMCVMGGPETRLDHPYNTYLTLSRPSTASSTSPAPAPSPPPPWSPMRRTTRTWRTR